MTAIPLKLEGIIIHVGILQTRITRTLDNGCAGWQRPNLGSNRGRGSLRRWRGHWRRINLRRRGGLRQGNPTRQNAS